MDGNKVPNWFSYKVAMLMRYMLVTGMVSALAFQLVAGQATASSSITSALCSIVNVVKSIIGILALVMFILGGALYGVAHFLPAAGNLRSGLQGWGMGMIMAGFIAFVIYLIAGYVIGVLISFANNGGSIISGIQNPTC